MKKRKVIYSLVGIFIFLVSFYLDNLVSKGMVYLESDLLTKILLGVTFISSDMIIFFFLTSLFLWTEHKRRWIFPLWLTLIVSVFSGYLLKIFFTRLRPYQTGIIDTLPILIEKSHLIWDYSFPSLHSIVVFCAIPILSKEFPRIKNYWILFAIIVAFSRIYFGLHYLSDVFFGMVIGLLIGNGVIYLEEKYKFGNSISKLRLN